VIAGVFVLACASVIIYYFEKPDQPDTTLQATTGIHEFRLADRPDIQRILAKWHQREVRRPPKKVKRPPPPPREISGFVQLAFTVKPDGSATNVHVVGAVPKGYYEQQAQEIVASRHYTPAKENGKRVARQMSDIIHFTVPKKQNNTSSR
jgi:TonB family protein